MVSKTEREQSQLNCMELRSDAIFDTGKTAVFMKIYQVYTDSVDCLVIGNYEN